VYVLNHPGETGANDVLERLDARGIRPLVQMRSLSPSEPERTLPDHEVDSNIV
jgi:hypothetical protein